MSHYDYLKAHLYPFLEAVGCENVKFMGGLISAHGDKSYGYFYACEKAGIPKEHCAMVHMLTYMRPYSAEVRATDNGFVNVGDWIIENYDRFKEHLPPVEDNDDEDAF